MTYALLFLPEIEDDAIGGFSWYETKSPGLGDEFLRMFYACASDIPRNPLLYQKVHKDFRRCLKSEVFKKPTRGIALLGRSLKL